VAVRWSPRYGLSYRDVEELLAELRVDVDHVTVYRRRRQTVFMSALRFARPGRGTRLLFASTHDGGRTWSGTVALSDRERPSPQDLRRRISCASPLMR
jgi:hypothetical protein